MWHDQVIVLFSNVTWEYLWYHHHQVAAHFAKSGNRVLFVDSIGLRVPNWNDRYRVLTRLRHRLEAGKRGIRPVRENIWVIDPLVIPYQDIEILHRLNVKWLTARIRHAIAQVGGGTNVIVWTYIPTRLALDVITNLQPQWLVYNCVDALIESPLGVHSSFAVAESKLSRQADVVFTTSPALYDRQRGLNPNTFYVPHGVEYETFAVDGLAEPATLKSIRHPRLAFFGTLDERLDLGLILRLATRHPDWEIIFLGVVNTDVSALQTFSNIHFLARVSHDELPAYLAQMDVFLMPYAYSPFMHYVNPAKLYQCLAVGKPTIAIGLPVFSEYRDVLRVANTPDEFDSLIADALHEGIDLEKIEQRRSLARANSWLARFAEMDAAIQTSKNGDKSS